MNLMEEYKSNDFRKIIEDMVNENMKEDYQYFNEYENGFDELYEEVGHNHELYALLFENNINGISDLTDYILD